MFRHAASVLTVKNKDILLKHPPGMDSLFQGEERAGEEWGVGADGMSVQGQTHTHISEYKVVVKYISIYDQSLETPRSLHSLKTFVVCECSQHVVNTQPTVL